MKLSGKIAVVTGGAMGNGLGIVKTFVKYGAKVIVLDYDEKINENLKEFGERADTGLHTHPETEHAGLSINDKGRSGDIHSF